MRVVLTAHIGTKYLFEGRLKSQISGKSHVSVAGLTEVIYALPQVPVLAIDSGSNGALLYNISELRPTNTTYTSCMHFTHQLLCVLFETLLLWHHNKEYKIP